MPEISIIVPIYNVEDHLHRCVDSILSQTFTDFELILVDDGSPDKCPAICDDYATKDQRVMVIHQNNKGVSSARNSGLDIATGKYIMFCDGDDYVDSLWCELMYNAINEAPNAWIVSNAWKVDNTGAYVQLYNGRSISNCSDISYFQIYQAGLSAYSWNKIYNSEIIRKRLLCFPVDQAIGEDVLFNIEYYKCCDSVQYIPHNLYYYYENSIGAMGTHKHNLFEINSKLFNARLPLIHQSELGAFCDIYLYLFMRWIELDGENRTTFPEKMAYKNKLIQSDVFSFCVSHASGSKDSPLFVWLLKLQNYYFLWFIKIIVRIKDYLKNRGD